MFMIGYDKDGGWILDLCANCGHAKKAHLSDSSCLFEPTRYKAVPNPELIELANAPLRRLKASERSEKAKREKVPNLNAPRRPSYKAPRPGKARR